MSRRRPTATRTCPYNPRRFKQWPFNQNLLNYKMILCKTSNRWSKQQMKQQCKHSRQKYWHTSTRTARAGTAKHAYHPSSFLYSIKKLYSNVIYSKHEYTILGAREGRRKGVHLLLRKLHQKNASQWGYVTCCSWLSGRLDEQFILCKFWLFCKKVLDL